MQVRISRRKRVIYERVRSESGNRLLISRESNLKGGPAAKAIREKGSLGAGERLVSRNAGFIRQRDEPHATLPDKSGVPAVVSRYARSFAFPLDPAADKNVRAPARLWLC